MWVRPYATDVTRLHMLEVFDKAQAMGVNTAMYKSLTFGVSAFYTGANAQAVETAVGQPDLRVERQLRRDRALRRPFARQRPQRVVGTVCQ